MENKNITKIILTIDDVTTTWETNKSDCTFKEVFEGFLGCMFAQGYVPGTEINAFQEHIVEMEYIYNNKKF